MADDPRSGQIKTFTRLCRKYFRDYGGWQAVFGSPFSIIAVGMAIVSYSSWNDDKWTGDVIQVIPNLLGFSLGTYALLFSLISNPIKNALKKLKNKQGIAYIDELNATFFHFILMQVSSFVWAYLYKQTLIIDMLVMLGQESNCSFTILYIMRCIGSFIGISLFLYSFLLAIAASLAVYRISRISEPD